MSNKLVRVNVRASAGSAKAEVRNGRDVLVVPSATMPDGIVMNEIMYPAEEIAKSYATLERTPAPFGHPIINGKYVPAKDPEALNIYGVGAFNVNVRRENGRVLLDKVIDVEIAKATAKGRSLLDAINSGKPIHTSTGLVASLEKSPEGKSFKFVARNIEFDHDAILTNEEGAAKPEQGVGMMVNNEKIEVVNSILEETDVDYAQSMIGRLASAITNALRGSKKEDCMDDKKVDDLSQKVVNLEEKLNSIPELIKNAVAAAVKPLTDNLAAIKANQETKDAEELAELTAKIVKANLLDAESAKELTLNAARALAKKAEPGRAASVNAAGFNINGGKPSFSLPKGDK